MYENIVIMIIMINYHLYILLYNSTSVSDLSFYFIVKV